MIDSWLLALVTAVATGLVTWGAIRVELRWLRRDVDHSHKRIDRIEGALIGRGARGLFGELNGNSPKHRAES
jgi:hypothetical protein